MLKTAGLIISTIFFLQGCTGLSTKQDTSPNVTSSPSGATVFANILELGTTPLRTDLYDAFPAGWKNSIYQAQGVLVVKKNGCKDYTLKVNDFILSKPIHAELECSNSEKSIATVSPPTTTPLSPTTNSRTEKRLKETETLFKKGIITEDEYKMTRTRILNEI